MDTLRPVLIINSYAGSLTQAASGLGHPILASLEDEGYGLVAQRLNFPSLEYHAKMPWPAFDLREAVVLAHPPCAAFSNQNASKNQRGVDAKKFRCTVNVLDYATGLGALAIAVESVPGALEGAREVHERFARERGYHLYRILQNACSFGLPQWRPRFWLILIREDNPRDLWLALRPSYRRLAEILQDTPGTRIQKLDEQFDLQVGRLLGAGLTYVEIDEILNGEEYGLLPAVIARHQGISQEVARRLYNWQPRAFMTSSLRLLDPNGLATTLLYDSWWFCLGRNLYREEYCRVMGFPAGYLWPERLAHRFREFLSRGVCPPVAAWVLEQLSANLGGSRPNLGPTHTKVIAPGETADFTITRKEVFGDQDHRPRRTRRVG